ncbi:hypothetical protein GCM10007425_07880 [Lysinibacillus alkalisoli]|uniref:Lipoprotein n=1 Tax=Lysinibacillus alkalisoli TaxID=1911548 RepID=A0A917G077_9BACI|nr:hypothetical protein [Lysinibacillus alkalisoli]GGG15996.1 hypothetical protein GCM10007425_07880 [Lysinibacillus alkalisoli]
MKRLYMLIVSVCLLLSACNTSQAEAMTVKEFYTKQGLQEIQEIVIINGETGAQMAVTNQEKIQRLLAQIDEVKMRPNKETPSKFTYSVLLNDEEKQFQFSDTLYESDELLFPIIAEFYQTYKS